MQRKNVANNLPTKIILTIQSAGQGLRRLGVSACDSRCIFKKRGVRVWIIICKQKFECYTACGPSDGKGNWVKINPMTNKPFRKKGYDLNKKAFSHILDKWANEIHGHSKRLDFRLKKTADGFSATFIKFSDNRNIQTSP